MTKRILPSAALLTVAFALMMGFAAYGASGVPAVVANQPVDDVVVAHPAHIHNGTCDTLGDVVYPLNDVSTMNTAPNNASPSVPLATPDASPEMSATGASPVASPAVGAGDVESQSTSEVAASLDDILGAEHAINVHESADEAQHYISCGNITGTPTDGQLTIELQELDGSGFNGEAILEDNGDGTTTVTVYLSIVGEDESETTPAS